MCREYSGLGGVRAQQVRTAPWSTRHRPPLPSRTAVTGSGAGAGSRAASSPVTRLFSTTVPGLNLERARSYIHNACCVGAGLRERNVWIRAVTAGCSPVHAELVTAVRIGAHEGEAAGGTEAAGGGAPGGGPEVPAQQQVFVLLRGEHRQDTAVQPRPVQAVEPRPWEPSWTPRL